MIADGLSVGPPSRSRAVAANVAAASRLLDRRFPNLRSGGFPGCRTSDPGPAPPSACSSTSRISVAASPDRGRRSAAASSARAGRSAAILVGQLSATFRASPALRGLATPMSWGIRMEWGWGIPTVLVTPELRSSAATIATVEGRHAAFLNLVNGEQPFPQAFDTPRTMDEVLAFMAPFIA